MSVIVMCDECGEIKNEDHALHCADAINSKGEMIYGADICKDCERKFLFHSDVYGWHARPKYITEPKRESEVAQ